MKINKNLELIFLIPISIIIFGHTSKLPIQIWDESRNAINALEMYANNNFLTTYYKGEPEMWNTKPPLLIWLQTLSLHLFGINEFAIRIPSILSAFLTCLTLFFFSKKKFGDYSIGAIASLLLVSTVGFIDVHSSKTGDYDSLLTFLTFISGINFYFFTETKSNKYLYLTALFLSLSILTKGIAGLLFLPAYFLYLIFKKQLFKTLANKHLYISLLIVIIPAIFYYLLREKYNPGYLEAVYNNELGGRFIEANENHTGSSTFYLDNLIKHQFHIFIFLFPFGLFLGLKDLKIKSTIVFSSIFFISFLIIISIAKTKLLWYNLPLFPYMTLISAIPIYKGVKKLKNYIIRKEFQHYMSIFIVILIFSIPYYTNLKNKIHPKAHYYLDPIGFYNISEYLRELKQEGNYTILYNDYKAHLYFYQEKLKQKNINISFGDHTKLNTNDIVITQDKTIKKHIENNYTIKNLDSYKTVNTYRIINKINPDE